MRISHLKQAIERGDALQLEVHSIDPSIYLVFINSDDRLEPLVDVFGKTIKFLSRGRAFAELKEAGVSCAHFVHKTAFEEMVGVGNGTTTEHREVIYL